MQQTTIPNALDDDDDGAALRLAVKLGISFQADFSIEIDGDYWSGCEAWIVKSDGAILTAHEVYSTDKEAATRRAIWRCAALLKEHE